MELDEHMEPEDKFLPKGMTSFDVFKLMCQVFTFPHVYPD